MNWQSKCNQINQQLSKSCAYKAHINLVSLRSKIDEKRLCSDNICQHQKYDSERFH